MLILTSPYNSSNNKFNKYKTPAKNINLNLINYNTSEKSIPHLEHNERKNLNNKTTRNKTTKQNKILFFKIKKLIAEFEKEKNEKERQQRINKKNNINLKTKKGKSTNNYSKIGPTSQKISLFPKQKVYSVPKIKSQMQFNRYLINDFKENDTELDYIKRSLKYQKINEDFDELIFLKQIKEVAKNGIREDFDKNPQKNEQEYFDTPDSEILKSSNSLKKIINKNVSEFNIDNSGKNNNINNNSNFKRYYTEQIQEIPKNFGKNVNKKGSNFNQNNYNFTERTKGTEKENSFIDENENNNNYNNKSPEQKLLIDIKNKNKIRETKRFKTKKLTSSMDKFHFSNRLYQANMKEYKRYIKKKQYIRGKNFSKHIALLNKEKEKLGIIETENEETNTERGLPRLIIPNLLFHIEYKDIFKNSFNTLRIFEEGDQDLDLDDLNKIRKAIKNYEIEMIKVLKKNNNVNYIKNHFNKTTVGKFKSTKGIYFSS